MDYTSPAGGVIVRGMVGAYWRAVHRRALHDTVKFLHLDSRERIVIGALIFVTAFVALWFFGSPDAAWDEAVAKIGPYALIALLFFPFVYAWKLISAPAQMEGEQAERIAQVEAQILKIREDMKPRIAFGRIVERLVADSYTTVSPLSGVRMGHSDLVWMIEVENLGNSMLLECFVKVERILIDPKLPVINAQASLSTEQRRIDGHVGRFKLGPYEKKLVVVARRSGDEKSKPPIELAAENRQDAIHRGHKQVLEVAGFAETGLPQRIALEIVHDSDGHASFGRVDPLPAA